MTVPAEASGYWPPQQQQPGKATGAPHVEDQLTRARLSLKEARAQRDKYRSQLGKWGEVVDEAAGRTKLDVAIIDHQRMGADLDCVLRQQEHTKAEKARMDLAIDHLRLEKAEAKKELAQLKRQHEAAMEFINSVVEIPRFGIYMTARCRRLLGLTQPPVAGHLSSPPPPPPPLSPPCHQSPSVPLDNSPAAPIDLTADDGDDVPGSGDAAATTTATAAAVAAANAPSSSGATIPAGVNPGVQPDALGQLRKRKYAWLEAAKDADASAASSRASREPAAPALVAPAPAASSAASGRRKSTPATTSSKSGAPTKTAPRRKGSKTADASAVASTSTATAASPSKRRRGDTSTSPVAVAAAAASPTPKTKTAAKRKSSEIAGPSAVASTSTTEPPSKRRRSKGSATIGASAVAPPLTTPVQGAAGGVAVGPPAVDPLVVKAAAPSTASSCPAPLPRPCPPPSTLSSSPVAGLGITLSRSDGSASIRPDLHGIGHARDIMSDILSAGVHTAPPPPSTPSSNTGPAILGITPSSGHVPASTHPRVNGLRRAHIDILSAGIHPAPAPPLAPSSNTAVSPTIDDASARNHPGVNGARPARASTSDIPSAGSHPAPANGTAAAAAADHDSDADSLFDERFDDDVPREGEDDDKATTSQATIDIPSGGIYIAPANGSAATAAAARDSDADSLFDGPVDDDGRHEGPGDTAPAQAHSDINVRITPDQAGGKEGGKDGEKDDGSDDGFEEMFEAEWEKQS
ncbi:MAG: hypothetical protein M1826_005747 [Phylliscum demangeonii]|nr:MAG: hypothetical protein M1826_005747 [Phylliscum demangeonii]